MQFLRVDGVVFQLRFLPDNRRLFVGTYGADLKVTFEILSLDDGGRVRLEVADVGLDSWFYQAEYGIAVAVHPGGESCVIAWDGRLHAFRTSDGGPMPVPAGVRAHQVALSPDGSHLLAAHMAADDRRLFAIATGPSGFEVLWQGEAPEGFRQLGGFLPDGERFVTLERVVRIRAFKSGAVLGAGRIKPVGTHQPQVSPDGRLLAAIGYGSLYFFDLVTLGKPRRIGGNKSFGDFRSVAFHPGGESVGVIHGGPTLVKIYDPETLKRRMVFRWKLGPLHSVAFSPDGALGAAGSNDGRIVVWDFDAGR